MSKERLEELLDDLPYSIRHSGELEPLKQFAREQAERVQELERQQKKNDDYTWKLLMDIKRYREALEEIKKEETVTTALSEGQVAYTISGHIARKALEGESE